MPRRIEQNLEKTLFASRWLMAPMYLGLVFALGILALTFVREMIDYIPHVMDSKSEDAILLVLTLIDLTLAGNLLLIVLFSGYENFVSKFDFDTGADRPDWMGKVDFSGLKMKLIASIVAISAIDLLKWFMKIEASSDMALMDRQLYWLVMIHLTFVLSGVLLALMDFLTSKADKH
ncbi:MAG: TIGR00645 family protein [Pseudorhodobacter sp.]|nr:TIGR00645 family protein [Pseudorhodobacter sp.]